MKAKRNAIHLSSVGKLGGGKTGKKTGRFIPCQSVPLICNFFFFMNTHISSSSGHMGLIRLPARAPLSHLQNPAEVKEYSSLLLFLLRLLGHKSVESLSLTWKQFFWLRPSAWPQGEWGGATKDGLCRKRPADLCYIAGFKFDSLCKHKTRVKTCEDDLKKICIRHFQMSGFIVFQYAKYVA